MKEFLKPKEQILKELKSDAQKGLSEMQVKKSRSIHGTNVLSRQKRDSLWKRIIEASTEPIILMLIAAGLIALGVNMFRGATDGEADYLERIGIFTAITLSVAISVVMEGKRAKAFEALAAIGNNVRVKALRCSDTIMLNQDDVVVGDILLLSTGDKLPADGRLLESTEISADESALTGESVPVEKDAKLVLFNSKLSKKTFSGHLWRFLDIFVRLSVLFGTLKICVSQVLCGH